MASWRTSTFQPLFTSSSNYPMVVSYLQPLGAWLRRTLLCGVRVDFIVIVEPFWQQGEDGFGVWQDDVSRVISLQGGGTRTVPSDTLRSNGA